MKNIILLVCLFVTGCGGGGASVESASVGTNYVPRVPNPKADIWGHVWESDVDNSKWDFKTLDYLDPPRATFIFPTGENCQCSLVAGSGVNMSTTAAAFTFISCSFDLGTGASDPGCSAFNTVFNINFISTGIEMTWVGGVIHTYH